MFAGIDEHYPKQGFESHFCKATKIAILSTGWDLSKCALRKLVANGAPDESVLLIGVSERMGIDMAFVSRGYCYSLYTSLFFGGLPVQE